jgi:hypothetical protein
VSQGRHAYIRKDSHWQDDHSLAERLHLWQVSVSHDKSPPLTTSLRLSRQVSVSHDKSPPRMTSFRIWLVRGRRHTARARPPVHAGKRISMSYRDDSWRPCTWPAPVGALNANLTSRAAITSPSTSALPHAKLNPRHSSTLYDAHGPRLRLTRGRTSKYSGRLRQTQTTRGESQASRKEQFNPATWRLPRKGIATRRRYAHTDSDVRRDVSAPNHCNSFIFPLVPLPLRL